jgi:transposase
MTALDRALVTGDPGRVADEHPDPEVPEWARRRRFTAQYKLDVVAEYDAAPADEKGAVLRREGLYSSRVIEWRRAPDSGALAGLARPRGRPAADPRDAQIARLQKDEGAGSARPRAGRDWRPARRPAPPGRASVTQCKRNAKPNSRRR